MNTTSSDAASSPHSSQEVWTAYWTEGFSTTLSDRLRGPAVKFWEALFAGHFAAGVSVRMVDLGTGRLFVPVLASSMARKLGAAAEIHAVDYAQINPATIPGAEGVRFRRASFDDTGFPDGFFDVVTSMYAVEYAEDFSRAVREAARIVRPKGVFGLLMHHPDSILAEHARSCIEQARWMREHRLLETFRALLVSPEPATDEAWKAVYAGFVAEYTRCGARKAISIAFSGAHALLQKTLEMATQQDLQEVLAFYDAQCGRLPIPLRQWSLLAQEASRWGDEQQQAMRAEFESQGFRIETCEHLTSGEGLLGWKVILRKTDQRSK